MTTTAPTLSEDELTQLDIMLSSNETDTLAIDEAHGYSTALLVRQQTINDPEWLEAILGDHKDTNDEVSTLLKRMRDEIQSSIELEQRFEPMIIEEEIDDELFESYEGWCFGFMLGVTQHQSLWETLPNNKEDLLAPIAQLALLYSDEELDINEDEYADCVELIPGAVTKLYDFWKNHASE